VVHEIATILEDPGAPIAETLAALMFIRRIDSHDALVLPILQRLGASREPVVAHSALNGLADRGESEAALALLRRCGEAPAYPYEGWRRHRSACLYAYGRVLELDLAGQAAETVRAILPSLEQEEQYQLVHRIASQRRSEAADLLIDALDAAHWQRNWRLGFEAAAGLTGLDVADTARADAALEAARRSHWMPAVREQAALALHGLRTGSLEGSGLPWADAQLAERAEHLETFRDNPRLLAMAERSAPRAFAMDFDEYLHVDRRTDHPHQDQTLVPGCRVWQWHGIDLEGPDANASRNNRRIITFAPHEFTLLAGSDFGEWSGGLTATGFGGRTRVLNPYMNVIDMTRSPRGVWVLSGMAHLLRQNGALYHVETPVYGEPSNPVRIATLPTRPLAMREIAPGRVAIFGTGWVAVADQHGIEGLASCTDAP
jgi:hypothetical protein